MTKELALSVLGKDIRLKTGVDYLITEDFLERVDEKFKSKWSKIFS
jgi:hypothetical protein